jgi:hypothetical protein
MKLQLTLHLADNAKPDEITFALTESARQLARFPSALATLNPNGRISLNLKVACVSSATLQRISE